MNTQKHIILDRDGVINFDSLDYIKTPDEWVPIPRSIEAIKKLCDEGYQIIIITNQSGIDRGIIQYNDFIDINTKMINEIDKAGGAISAILYCPTLPSVKN